MRISFDASREQLRCEKSMKCKNLSLNLFWLVVLSVVVSRESIRELLYQANKQKPFRHHSDSTQQTFDKALLPFRHLSESISF